MISQNILALLLCCFLINTAVVEGVSAQPLRGDYHDVSYYVDSFTVFGEVTISADGTGTYHQIETSTGGGIGNAIEAYTVSSDGALTIGDDKKGVVSDDDQFVFFVDIGDPVGIEILAKKSSGIPSAMLDGNYHGVSYYADEDGFTAFGDVSLDGNGNAAYVQIDTSGGGSSGGTTAYTVTSDGEITIGSDRRGVVSADGNYIFFVDLGDPVGIEILAKKSVPSAATGPAISILLLN